MNTLNEIRYAELSFTDGYPITGEFSIVDGWFQLKNNRDGIRLYNPQYVWRIIPITEESFSVIDAVIEYKLPF